MRRLAPTVTCLAAAVAAVGLGLPTAAVASPSGWRVTTTSQRAGTPNAIACDSHRGCVLVGALNAKAFALNGALAPDIRAVTCDSVGCTGVGTVIINLRAWRRTGKRWVRMPFDPPIGGLYEGSLSSVTCVSASDCLAVGNIDAHTHVDCAPNSVGLTVCETLVPVLEHWDGTSWQRQTTFPVPVMAQLAVPVGSEQGYSALDAVSCASARSCVAVGDVGSTSVGGSGLVIGPTFADTWNGTSWKLAILPTPSGSDPQLMSISCTSHRRCVAVGSVRAGGMPRPYAAEERDGVWSDASPTIAGSGLLSSVSCAPDGMCAAVGYRGTGTGERPLVERWQAERWTLEPAQLPRNSRLRGGTQLVSVSCTAAGARHHDLPGIGSCAAAGEYDKQTHLGLNVGWFVESLGPALPLRTSS